MSPNGPVASSGYAIEGREALALFGRVAEVVQFKELVAAASQREAGLGTLCTEPWKARLWALCAVALDSPMTQVLRVKYAAR